MTDMTNITEHTPLSIQPGETGNVQIVYSEAACHLRVAGKCLPVTLLDHRMAQIHNEDGSKYSFPVTAGEAGIYWNASGHYYYTDPTSPLNNDEVFGGTNEPRPEDG